MWTNASLRVFTWKATLEGWTTPTAFPLWDNAILCISLWPNQQISVPGETSCSWYQIAKVISFSSWWSTGWFRLLPPLQWWQEYPPHWGQQFYFFIFIRPVCFDCLFWAVWENRVVLLRLFFWLAPWLAAVTSSQGLPSGGQKTQRPVKYKNESIPGRTMFQLEHCVAGQEFHFPRGI